VDAAEHAATAAHATGSVGTLPAKERVCHLHTGLSEVDAHRRAHVAVGDAKLRSELVQQLVRGVGVGVFYDAEHALRLGVVGRKLRLPIRQLTPLGMLEKGLARHVQRARVTQAATADTAA
jgi:hypothetical protein